MRRMNITLICLIAFFTAFTVGIAWGQPIAVTLVATLIRVMDNESTNEWNVILFGHDAKQNGGDLGVESDGDLVYNPSTGTIKAIGLTDGTATLTGGAISGLTTPLTVAQGGSGAATFTDGGVLLGSGTGAITPMAVLADGEFIVGDGTTDPVAESGETAMASLGIAANWIPMVNHTETDTERRTWKSDVRLDHVYDVRDFGATGDGVTDDTAAFVSALAAGNYIFIPDGTYKVNLDVLSNKHIVGQSTAGTILIGVPGASAPDNLPIDIRGVIADPKCAINTPTEGDNTVTTTTASDATNFSPGDYVFIAGNLNGTNAEYPAFITQVVSSNGETGIITITEKLRRTDYTCVHPVTSYPQNVTIENLTLYSGDDVGLVAAYARKITLRNIYFASSLTTAAGSVVSCRDVLIDNCVFEGKNFGIHSTVDSTIRDCVFRETRLIFEGGCDHCVAQSNFIYDPDQTGIFLDTKTEQVCVENNVIVNVPNLYNGISVNGNDEGYGNNVIIGNIITGGGVGDNGITVGAVSHDNLIQGNQIDGTDYGIQIATTSLRNHVFGNRITNAVLQNLKIDDLTASVKPHEYFSLGNGAISAGYLDFYEDSDNGTNYIRIIGPASTGDDIITLPTDTEVAKTGALYNTAGILTTATEPALTSIVFADEDASPAAVGKLKYDNTVTGLDDGGMVWYDDDEIRTIIDLDASEVLAEADDAKLVRYNWGAGAGYFDLVAAGAGIVTSVGDGASAAALDGTVDGGTWIKFYDAQGIGQLITGDLTVARVWTLPDASGTLALAGGAGANQALDNLAGVAINTSLISDTAATDDLGTEALYWRKIYNGTDISFEGATDNEFQTTLSVTDPTADRAIVLPDAAGTIALTANNLSVFAATTSAQLRGVLSDETGTGVAVFGTNPTIYSPTIDYLNTTLYLHDTLNPIVKLIRRRDGDPTDNVSDDDILGQVTFRGYHTNADYLGAHIQAVVDNTPGASDMPSRLEFYTSADASATPTLRLTIDSAGLATFAGGIAGALTGNVTGNADTATTAGVATTVTITDNESTAENNPLVFVADADPDGGNLGLESDGTTYYTPSTGVITATGFAGALTGNVTGDVSGSSGSCTGNAATATLAATSTVVDSTYASDYVGLWGAATGSLAAKTDAGLTYDATTGILTATGFSGPLTGNVTGNASGTAATVTGAAQANITSLGTLTTLTVDDITINGNTISSAGASTLAITPTAGQAITLDGAVTVDAGVVAGITSLTTTNITTTTNIKSEPKHMIFTIMDPLSTQTEDNEICIWPVTPAALTVTKIVVTLDAAANEVLGDIKYADTFIGLANAVVINDFDTTSGVRTDDTITSAAVAAGKCIYISFDSAPNTAIHQMSVDITFSFD